MYLIILFFINLYLFKHFCEADAGKNSNKLHYCLDGRHHKSAPGPESVLFSECTHWKNNSCCTQNTTRGIQELNLYKINYHHCGRLSDKCAEHFKRDLCFYECSPNIGPWVDTVESKIRKERYYKVPLCGSECDKWFQDCRDDKTCTKNWTHDLKLDNGIKQCISKDDCRTFQEIYGNAKDFCEMVWDNSWEYTSDDKPCMQIWFDGKKGNPNDYVTSLKIEELLKLQEPGKSSAYQHVKMEYYLPLSYVIFYCLWVY